MNLGFVSTRLAGTDGVSLETRKWAAIYREMGHHPFFCAGQLDPDLEGMVAPLMHFDHPEVRAIQARIFGTTEPDPQVRAELLEMAHTLQGDLAAFCAQYDIHVLVVENALAIPMHVPLGVAIARFIRATDFPTIAHHHDFFWERERFAVNIVGDLLEEAFPPAWPTIRHVVINSLARQSLRDRRGLESVLVPNIFDYARAAPGMDEHNADLRAALGLDDGHLFVLQPTRVVPRKGIELAIDLVRRMALPRHAALRQHKEPVLVITHHAGDEGMAYLEHLQSLAAEAGIGFIYAADRFVAYADPRQLAPTEANGPRHYRLWDAYVHADFVTYPSLYEGFGNALLETLYFRLPALVNRYPVYVADIAPLGMDLVEIQGAIREETVAESLQAMMDPVRRRRMTEWNYEVARRHFSYQAVTPILARLLAETP